MPELLPFVIARSPEWHHVPFPLLADGCVCDYGRMIHSNGATFPFAAIVGQDLMRLSLALNATSPSSTVRIFRRSVQWTYLGVARLRGPTVARLLILRS